MIKVALFGLGTVGVGVLNIIRDGNLPIKVVAVVDRSYQKKQHILQDIPASDDPNFVLNNSSIEVDAIVELIGGTSLALFIIREALDRRIPVITANKALLAEHGYALFNKSKETKTPIFFEASVAGAIPIIHNLMHVFNNDKVFRLEGILNGTSNYMLTKMRTDKLGYQQILKQAQDLGFAEADPSFDVNGSDAAQKLSILSSLLSGYWVDWHKIFIKGIDTIELKDILWAEKNNFRIRLVGNFLCKNNTTYVWLEPKMIASSHHLWDVELENNAIVLEGKYSGPHLLVGKGAGSLPTGYSVISDILRLKTHTVHNSVFSNTLEYGHVSQVDMFEASMYMRLQVIDETGILSKISSVLSQKGISIASIFQEMEDKIAYLYIVTHSCLRGNFEEALSILHSSNLVQGTITSMPLDIA